MSCTTASRPLENSMSSSAAQNSALHLVSWTPAAPRSCHPRYRGGSSAEWHPSTQEIRARSYHRFLMASGLYPSYAIRVLSGAKILTTVSCRGMIFLGLRRHKLRIHVTRAGQDGDGAGGVGVHAALGRGGRGCSSGRLLFRKRNAAYEAVVKYILTGQDRLESSCSEERSINERTWYRLYVIMWRLQHFSR